MHNDYMYVQAALDLSGEKSQVFKTPNMIWCAIQVSGDDSTVFNLEASLDGSNWDSLSDTDGGSDQQVESAPVRYNIERYNKIRVAVTSPNGSYTAYIKAMDL